MSVLFPELESGSSPATTVAPPASAPTPGTAQAPQQQTQSGPGGGGGGGSHGATLIEKADDKTIERLNKLFALPGPFGFVVAEAELVRGVKLQLVLRGDGLEDLSCALTRSPDAKPFLTTTHFGITYHGETPDKRHLAFLKRVAFLLKEVPLVALQRLF